jgi:hypothetical protein
VDVSEAVQITAADAEDELRDLDDDEAMTRRALNILRLRRNDDYEAALAELREDTQGWWADTLKLRPDELEENEEQATADADGLRRFLEYKVLPWFEKRKEEIDQRPLLRDEAFGESLDPDKLERLGRYEVHLDRKLERMLSMLLRLRELRRAQDLAQSVSQNGAAPEYPAEPREWTAAPIARQHSFATRTHLSPNQCRQTKAGA